MHGVWESVEMEETHHELEVLRSIIIIIIEQDPSGDNYGEQSVTSSEVGNCSNKKGLIL